MVAYTVWDGVEKVRVLQERPISDEWQSGRMHQTVNLAVTSRRFESYLIHHIRLPTANTTQLLIETCATCLKDYIGMAERLRRQIANLDHASSNLVPDSKLECIQQSNFIGEIAG